MGFDWDAFEGVDSISVWNSSTQSYYDTFFWVTTDDFSIVGSENVWIDVDNLVTDFAPTVGTSLFISSQSSVASVVLSGEVYSDTLEPIILKQGFSQISNPYPVALPLQNISFTGLTGFDWDAFEGIDSVTIWNPNTQSYYDTFFWVTTDDFAIVGSENVWIDVNNEITDFKIPVGGSLFIYRSDSEDGSASFTPPNLD